MKNILNNIILGIITTVLFFTFLEGLTGYIFFFTKAAKEKDNTEKAHTQYDSLLGWSNIPGLYKEGIYGPGTYIKINSQGFRNEKEFDKRVPERTKRIICSGDSFTLGHGVSNNQTWPYHLAELGWNVETVNMGQGGYGIAQTYLWYMRDGVRLDHNIHLFAFITEDFLRAEHKSFLSYGKPVLRIEGNKLVTKNVPVPRYLSRFPWITRNLKHINALNTVQFLRKTAVWLVKLRSGDGSGNLSANSEKGGKKSGDTELSQDSIANTGIAAVAIKIFEELKAVNEKEGSRFYAVYLPTKEDYKGRPVTEQWRKFLSEELPKRGIGFIDIVDDIRSLDEDELNSLYNGHFSDKGNRFVAEKIYEHIDFNNGNWKTKNKM